MRRVRHLHWAFSQANTPAGAPAKDVLEQRPKTRAELIEGAKANGAPALCVNWSEKALKRWASK